MADRALEKTASVSLSQVRRLLARWLWLPLVLGAGLFLVWALATGWRPGMIATDIGQQRSNATVAAPGETTQIRQTFVPRHNGLTEVELLLVRHDEAANNSRLGFQLLDAAGKVVVARDLQTQALSHNETFTLRFPPQPASAGQMYTLLVSGTTGNNVSVWGYDLDVYEDGALSLVGGNTSVQDLRFTTRYRMRAPEAAKELVKVTLADGGLILLALALILMPGCLVLLAARRWTTSRDPAARLGIALAIGLSLWPLLWLWLSELGGRWTGWALWLVLVLGWLVVIGLYVLRRQRPASLRPRPLAFSWHHGALLLIVMTGLAVRLLAVRDLAFPPWVDSSRHALITAVMAESGQSIEAYLPLLPVETFPYHFGFHTLSATLAQMTNTALPRLLLILGQLINALVSFTVYVGAYLLTRRKGVALLAAFLVALPLFFPGYYVTWGRMTQLMAMLLLPLALAVTWRLVRGAPNAKDDWWLVALFAAGLFLIHFRVFLLYLPLVGLLWLLTRGRRGRRLLLAAILAFLLVAPRFVQLTMDPRRANILTGTAGYSDFPTGYISVGWETAFLWLTAASLILVLLAALHNRRWALLPLFLAAWAGLATILLSGNRLGLPETWVINLNSAYISLFLPQAFILAITAGGVWRWLAGRHWLLITTGRLLAGIGVAAALIFGARQQITIVNPQTILAHPQDQDTLAWLGQNLPSSSKVAVSSWLWLGNIWAGSDGGAWIVPLTGLTSTTPPVDYIYDRSLAQEVQAFNETASKIEDWSDPGAAEWLGQQAVTHIYVGARGGFFDPAALARNPGLEQLYSRDGTFVFALN